VKQNNNLPKRDRNLSGRDLLNKDKKIFQYTVPERY